MSTERPHSTPELPCAPRRPSAWRVLLLLLAVVVPARGAAAQSVHPDRSAAQARQLLRDAQQWAEFGNLTAARALARRAASLDVVWTTSDTTPEQFLQSLEPRPEASAPPAAVESRGDEVDMARPPQSSLGDEVEYVDSVFEELAGGKKTDAPNQTASYHVAAGVESGSPLEWLDASAGAAPAPAPEATALVARPFLGDAFSTAPAAQPPAADAASARVAAQPNGADHMEENVPDRATSLERPRLEPAPRDGAEWVRTVPFYVPANAPAASAWSNFQLAAVSCAVGLLLCPMIIFVGTLLLGRFLGGCSPVIRVEFLRMPGPAQEAATTSGQDSERCGAECPARVPADSTAAWTSRRRRTAAAANADADARAERLSKESRPPQPPHGVDVRRTRPSSPAPHSPPPHSPAATRQAGPGDEPPRSQPHAVSERELFQLIIDGNKALRPPQDAVAAQPESTRAA